MVADKGRVDASDYAVQSQLVKLLILWSFSWRWSRSSFWITVWQDAAKFPIFLHIFHIFLHTLSYFPHISSYSLIFSPYSAIFFHIFFIFLHILHIFLHTSHIFLIFHIFPQTFFKSHRREGEGRMYSRICNSGPSSQKIFRIWRHQRGAGMGVVVSREFPIVARGLRRRGRARP